MTMYHIHMKPVCSRWDIVNYQLSIWFMFVCGFIYVFMKESDYILC